MKNGLEYVLLIKLEYVLVILTIILLGVITLLTPRMGMEILPYLEAVPVSVEQEKTPPMSQEEFVRKMNEDIKRLEEETRQDELFVERVLRSVR